SWWCVVVIEFKPTTRHVHIELIVREEGNVEVHEKGQVRFAILANVWTSTDANCLSQLFPIIAHKDKRPGIDRAIDISEFDFNFSTRLSLFAFFALTRE